MKRGRQRTCPALKTIEEAFTPLCSLPSVLTPPRPISAVGWTQAQCGLPPTHQPSGTLSAPHLFTRHTGLKRSHLHPVSLLTAPQRLSRWERRWEVPLVGRGPALPRPTVAKRASCSGRILVLKPYANSMGTVPSHTAPNSKLSPAREERSAVMCAFSSCADAQKHRPDQRSPSLVPALPCMLAISHSHKGKVFPPCDQLKKPRQESGARSPVPCLLLSGAD